MLITSTGLGGYASVTVYDINTYSTTAPKVTATHSQCVLMARVGVISTSGTKPQMVEWSVGVKGSSAGIGLLASTEPTWREVTAMGDVMVFTTHSSHIKGDTYSRYIYIYIYI